MAKGAIVMCRNDQDSWKIFDAGASFILQHSLVGLTGVDPKRTVKLIELEGLRKVQETNFSISSCRLATAAPEITVTKLCNPIFSSKRG